MTGKTRTVPIPVSERMRLYRQRRRQGMRLVRLPLQVTNIDDLVLGLLKQDELSKRGGTAGCSLRSPAPSIGGG